MRTCDLCDASCECFCRKVFIFSLNFLSITFLPKFYQWSEKKSYSSSHPYSTHSKRNAVKVRNGKKNIDFSDRFRQLADFSISRYVICIHDFMLIEYDSIDTSNGCKERNKNAKEKQIFHLKINFCFEAFYVILPLHMRRIWFCFVLFECACIWFHWKEDKIDDNAYANGSNSSHKNLLKCLSCHLNATW